MEAVLDRATQYAKDVVSGKVVAGQYVINTCQRHLNDLKRKDITYSPEKAGRAIKFFEGVLKLAEGQYAGKPFLLHPSQAFIVGSIFGWIGKDGFRRFRRAYLEIGKGNGKSPLLAGLGLYGFVADREAAAEIYVAAAVRDQAQIIFQDMVKMTDASPILLKRVTYTGINPVQKISDLKTMSFIRPVSRDARKTGSGYRPHIVLVDELHEHPDRLTLEMMERGFKFRQQPLVAIATNSGTDRNSVCYEEHLHAVAVAAGDVEDDRTFSFVCALDEHDDPFEDESCWIKANPLLGTIVQPNVIRDAVKQCKSIPGRINNVLRLHFCVWTDSETAWVSKKAWQELEDEGMSLDDFRDQPCCAALDLSTTLDLTAWAAVFLDGFLKIGDKLRMKLAVFVHAYMPEHKLEERIKEDQAPYDVWIRDGWLTATPGAKVDYDTVISDLVGLSEKHELKLLAYDRALYRKFSDKVASIGEYFPTKEHPQGFAHSGDSPLWMPESLEEVEAGVFEKRIRVQPNPVLSSAVSHAAFITNLNGLRRFTKEKSTGRIDALIAMTMGVGAAINEFSKVDLWTDPDYKL